MPIVLYLISIIILFKSLLTELRQITLLIPPVQEAVSMRLYRNTLRTRFTGRICPLDNRFGLTSKLVLLCRAAATRNRKAKLAG